MADQTPDPRTIPADKVRDLRDQYMRLIEDAGTKEAQAYYGHVVDDLDALLPAPPTLADMPDDERAACQWMQANVKGYESRVVIVNPYWAGAIARVMWPDTRMGSVPWRSITPRTDLPGLEWPGDHKPAPALPDGWRLADHEVYGRVVVTTQTPSESGNVYFVFSDPNDAKGHYWHLCAPDRLTYLDDDQ